MEQLNFNTMKNLKSTLYPHNRVSTYNNKNNTEINHYPVYSKQENKKNIKCLDIFNINSEINYINNEFLDKENKVLTNYYSYPQKKMNNKQNKSIKNNILFDQYSSKEHLQSKDYLYYLQSQRNTYDLKDKNMKNLFYSDNLK